MALKQAFADQLRAIEDNYPIHYELCCWGQWSNQGRVGEGTVGPGIYAMTGDPDPDRDLTAAPSKIRPAFNERRMQEIDIQIHNITFPALWRKVLKANYVPAKYLACILPEYQRPREARCTEATYIAALEMALDKLQEKQ